MTYDVDAGPPRSVRLQWSLEEQYRQLRNVLQEHDHIVLIALLVGYVSMAGDPSDASRANSVAADISAVDVATTIGWAAVIGVGLLVVISLHEICHLVAYRRFGISAEWTIEWIVVPVVGVKAYPYGGLCSALDLEDYLHLSWTEDAIVALAPLVLVPVALVPVGLYHVFIDPFTSPMWVAVGVLALVGPSPPDYWSLTDTPRHKWERLCDYRQRVENHGAAEGC